MDQRIIDGIKDFRLFAEAFLRINVKNASNDNSTSPFILNRAQLFTHAKLEAQKAKLGRVRALILKGRQQGLSTMVQGRNFHNIITTTGKIAFIMAHEGDATDNLFKITRRFYDNLPAGLCPPASKLNTTEMEFDCFQSAYRVGTAGNKKTGRGQTIHLFHGSEVAFWENTDDLTTGILQAIPDAPGTESILESTANGTGNFFHSLWLDAESGKSDYIPIFIPWYWQDEYRSSAEGMICDQDELEILEQHEKNGLTLEHLSWRRIKLGNLNRDDERARDMFKQEYPFTSAEAFLNPVKDSFIKPRFVNKARNTSVETDMGLIIGVDPADDKDGSDRTAIIFRRGRRAYGLKTYRNHNTMQLAGVLVQMIKQHNPIKVYIDCIGIGKGTVDRLQELGYECVVGLNVATNAHNKEIYANRRAELWDEMREWFIQDMGVEIPDSDELQTDLVSVWAKYRSNGQLVMSSKDEMKKLGLPSPDTADALMHSFAGGFFESSINRTVERIPDHHRSMFT